MKIIQVISLKKEEKHLSGGKSHFGKLSEHLFLKRNLESPSHTLLPVPIPEALILLPSHLSQDQERWEDIVSIF